MSSSAECFERNLELLSGAGDVALQIRSAEARMVMERLHHFAEDALLQFGRICLAGAHEGCDEVMQTQGNDGKRDWYGPNRGLGTLSRSASRITRYSQSETPSSRARAIS